MKKKKKDWLELWVIGERREKIWRVEAQKVVDEKKEPKSERQGDKGSLLRRGQNHLIKKGWTKVKLKRHRK